MNVLNLQSARARKARLAHRIGKPGFGLMIIGIIGFAALAGFFYWREQERLAYATAALTLLYFMMAAWYRQELAPLAPTGPDLHDRLSSEVLHKLPTHQALTPKLVWQALSSHWQARFFINRILWSSVMVEERVSTAEEDMSKIWDEATRLADTTESPTIDPGHIIAAIFLVSPGIQSALTHDKLSTKDIEALALWLGRGLEAARQDKPYFGGIGRDWASGYTPQLDRFGHNVSLSIEGAGSQYSWLADSSGTQDMKNAFSQGAAAIALIGPPGIGKTSHVYALAQAILAENNDRALAHKQLVSLNPAMIISHAGQAGQLERTMISLLSEALHAGNIMLFFDDAQLFFGEGRGSFDATQILLPVAQARRIQMIFAMSPSEFQSLKANQSAFASQLTPVVLKEMDEHSVMRVLEDSAINLEHKHHVLITYLALREAYRLSGRYESEIAYPGKAIQLLEQALPHANQKVVTPESVQAAIEQTKGVKVGTAGPTEADALLHLEDKIHERMINQKRAVEVVSSALRRARAGVANPERPIGSFLFLGPTGVGKTELAKAIAATYFGAESNLIRLDMSEYQQADDVQRLLSDGSADSNSLIMAVRQQPFSVVLLDEIEKAHGSILNLLLQILDEGRLTDARGRAASFKDSVLITTSNAGANDIREHIERGEELEDFEAGFIDKLIASNQFKPELLNRFDEIVLFRPLNKEELAKVIALMMKEINATLAPQNISVKVTEETAKLLAERGYDPRLGARPMRRMLQRTVENIVATRILHGETQAGDKLVIDVNDLQ